MTPFLNPSRMLSWSRTFVLLDLTRCLSILFWISACEYTGSSDFAFMAL